MSGSDSDLIKLITTALELASTAVHFDTKQNLIGACDYYDKCILHIDEVLSLLPINSVEWNEFATLRSKYDDRMETLRDLEKGKFDVGTLSLGSSSGAINERKPHHGRTAKRKRQSLLLFEENSFLCNAMQAADISAGKNYLQPPVEPSKRPYWQMRIIKNTITQGGFLTPTIYVPTAVWSQVGVKFAGLHAKSSAFKSLLHVTSTIAPLPFDDTEHALNNALMALKSVSEEVVVLQNHLSKSFHFIREVVVVSEEKEFSSNKGQVARLTSIVSSIGKSVKKYAEVGISRFSALPAHVSDEEFSHYVELTLSLCEHCQILDQWHDKLKIIRLNEAVDAAALREAIAANRRNSASARSGMISGDTAMLGVDEDDIDISEVISNKQALIQEIGVELNSISEFMKNVVCEILLRDVEALIDRYLKKTRKGFARMHWDDDSAPLTAESILES